jgi:hypothetical protein
MSFWHDRQSIGLPPQSGIDAILNIYTKKERKKFPGVGAAKEVRGRSVEEGFLTSRTPSEMTGTDGQASPRWGRAMLDPYKGGETVLVGEQVVDGRD